METITQPLDEWKHWSDELRFFADPPDALVVSVAWDSGDGMVTSVNVWDSPGSMAVHFVERAQSVIEAEGEPANKPKRHGEPVEVYIRS